MEALAAVASVAGVLSLTIQGIETIGKLKIFCDNFKRSDQVMAEFVHDLTVLATLLCSVKSLCAKMKVVTFPQKPGYHLASMKIQIEDCTDDLEKWYALAERYRQTSTRSQHKSGLSVRAMIRAFIAAVEKESRVAVRIRCRWHMENIQASLSILGRELDLLHSQALQSMDNKIENLSDTLEHHSKSQEKQLEELSSSSNSNLAISISNEERLENIQCMVTDLLETMSGKSSQTSSKRPSKIVVDSELEPNNGKKSSEMTSTAAPNPSPATELTDSQLSLLSESTELLASGTRKVFPASVSEYVLLTCASRTLKICAEILVLPTVSVNFGERSTLNDRTVEAARRMCYLRDICRAENLEDSLNLADDLLGIGVKQIEDCEELAAQKLIDEIKCRDSLIRNIDFISMDKTTLINEWLLGVLQAKKKEASLHKAIIRPFLKSDERYSTDDTFLREWPRLVLKYWFQDHEGESSREQLSSSSGWASNGDSDPTITLDDYPDEINNSVMFSPRDLPLTTTDELDEYVEHDEVSRASAINLYNLPRMDFHTLVEEDEDPRFLKEQWSGPELPKRGN